MKNEIIEIKEEVKIPGTDIILEVGDKIKIQQEKLDLRSFNYRFWPEGYKPIDAPSIQDLIKKILDFYSREEIQQFSKAAQVNMSYKNGVIGYIDFEEVLKDIGL